MNLKYITEPLDKYVTRTKNANMTYTRTTITCPLCMAPFPKRDFENHVFNGHGTRVDECFAKLFGISHPSRCTCGKELHYSPNHRGFPTTCGNCATGTLTGVEYKSVDDANAHVSQLEALLAQAKAQARKLEKEAELEKIPLEKLPFPSRKDPSLLMRISKLLRTHAVNGDRDKLIELANFIDKKVAEI